MNLTQGAVIAFSIVLILGGFGCWMGWFEDITDYLPWHSDTGDLHAYVSTNDSVNTSALSTSGVQTSGIIALQVGNTTPVNATVTILSTELTKQTTDGWANFTDVEVGQYEVEAEYNSTTMTKNATIEEDKVTELMFDFSS